jgi:N-acetyl-alpha-D-glucosaminyl L-malate synthase BshA
MLDDRWSDEDLDALVAMIFEVMSSASLDVLHFHYAVPFAEVASRLLARLSDVVLPVIGTLHGTDVSIHGLDPERGPHLRKHLLAFDEITTVSVAHGALATAVLDLPTAPTVIPNFVDATRFRPRPQGDGRTTRPVIVYASNFRAVKNPQSAARIFAGIRQEVDAELWLVGDGAEMPSTRRVLEQEGIEADVRFLGLRRDIERILPRAELALVTSRYESFSLFALEAAACGVPVVAARVGGLPEVVVDGRTGRLYDVENDDAGVRAALRLLRDEDCRSAMGRAAAEHAARFSSSRVIPRYERLYKDVIERAAEGASAMAG